MEPCGKIVHHLRVADSLTCGHLFDPQSFGIETYVLPDQASLPTEMPGEGEG